MPGAEVGREERVRCQGNRSRAAREGGAPFFEGPFVALAHRGGAKLAANLGRENTVHAFAQATRLGYRYLETDVHTTADGVLIAFHDTVLDRVTDASGAVADTPWSEVSRARISGTDPVPTFSELLETFPEQRFNVDLKSDGAVEPLLQTLRRHRAGDRVCVGSFSTRRLRRFRRLARGGVATSATPLEAAWTRLVPVLPRLLPTPGVALQVPVQHRVAGGTLRLVTPATIARAHAAGRQVHVWTIDDEREMNALIDLGVDGLVSDAIDTLKRVLVARDLWS